jgi:hypothetical protein
LIKNTLDSFAILGSTGETSWTEPQPNNDDDGNDDDDDDITRNGTSLSSSLLRLELTNDTAAIIIQKLWRARKARQKLQELLHSVYQRMFDPATQAYFYHNVKTGDVSWYVQYENTRHDDM